MKATATLFFLLMLAPWVRAEYRLWTDKAGKTIEAEHVITLDTKVVLRMQDGTELRILLDSLCEADRREAILLRPPRVEIIVSAKVDRANEAVGLGRRDLAQAQTESIAATVTIKKASPAPYDAPLASEIVLLGLTGKTEQHVILERLATNFTFEVAGRSEASYATQPVSLRRLEAGRQVGIEYDGYLCIVRDRKGDILEMKCSKALFREHAETILAAKRGTLFDSGFLPVDRQAPAAKESRPRFQLFPGRKR